MSFLAAGRIDAGTLSIAPEPTVLSRTLIDREFPGLFRATGV